MSRLSVRFVATSLAAAIAAPSAGAAQAASSTAVPQGAPSPQAAPSGARVLTLDDALALAEARNESVLIAEAGVRRARGVEAQVHSQRLPQLTGNASYDRTLASEFDGIFDTDSLGEGEENAFADLPFGQPNAYRLGLSFSQLIYAGGRERALEKQARLGRDVATLSVTAVKAQLALDVAQAFYDAALADRLVGIADDTLAQASRSFEQTRAKREAGLVSEFELLRAQVDRDTLQSPRVRAGNTRDVAYFRLKQLLDLPLATPLQLAAQLDDPRLVPAARFASRLAEAEAATQPRLRLAVTQADLGVQVSEQGVAIADAQRKPAVALQSSAGIVNYPVGVPGGRRLAQELDGQPGRAAADPDRRTHQGGAEHRPRRSRQRPGAAAADQGAVRPRRRQRPRVPRRGTGRLGSGGRHHPAGGSCLRNRRAALPGRPVDAARAVGRASAAGAGPGEPGARGARSAIDAGSSCSPARAAARGGCRGGRRRGRRGGPGSCPSTGSNATASTGPAQAPAPGATATPAATGAQGARQ